MSKYQNPIPSLDDEYVSTDFSMGFHFEEPMTIKDAAENLENYIKTCGLPPEWVKMGKVSFLESPEKLNKIKDRLGKERLHGEWLPLGKRENNWIHCECSICGHREEAFRAVMTGKNSGDYTEAVYRFCSKCGSSMSAGEEARKLEKEQPMEQNGSNARQKLRIETPRGRIEADIIPDDEYPGIAVTVIDANGDEISSAILEWHAVDEQHKLRVFTPNDPDGDPAHIIPMSRAYYHTQED